MAIDVIFAAARALAGGDVVALPTETVYGLAASIESESALGKIFQIKGRPLLDPLIVHVLEYEWISRYAYVDGIGDRVKILADTFWPGPLTIILRKKSRVPPIVTAGRDSVALRCPAHEIFRKVLAALKIPLAAPSANPFGYLSPTTAQHVRDSLGDRVQLIVDGGKCSIGVESTILDMTTDVPRILRPGAISAGDIARIIGMNVADYCPAVSSQAAPGQLRQHYSPNTRLVLFENLEDISTLMGGATPKKAAFVLLERPKHSLECGDVFWLSENGSGAIIAQNLFDVLRALDLAGYGVIYCQKAEPNGFGTAINDRLTRAAAKFAPAS
ncbi:MAG: threonylcarbamoyl-AMP synthase [Puniceicoccales bacterium]|jgi:L-threonylcarbamoyladenylate synthase|nr:threonylcarbamoyl-AMP synthase [Puniceicoccales bacterium]